MVNDSDQSKILLLSTLSRFLGWTYFLCWAFSAYPQIIINCRRKSVTGLSIDYFTINILGHSCYTVSCLAFLYSNVVREQYRRRFPDAGEPTVRVNDLAFTAHSLFWSCFAYSQFYVWGYKRYATQRLSKASFYYIVGNIVFIIGVCGLILTSPQSEETKPPGLPTTSPSPPATDSNNYNLPSYSSYRGTWKWLDLIYTLGIIKLLNSFIKYYPQALLNYRNKSTHGWSILKCLLDFSGAILSLFQLFIDAHLASVKAGKGGGFNFSAVIGNPLKFWLGLVSVVFDVVFIVQHYVLYPAGKSKGMKRKDNSDMEGGEEERVGMLTSNINEGGERTGARERSDGYGTIPFPSS